MKTQVLIKIIQKIHILNMINCKIYIYKIKIKWLLMINKIIKKISIILKIYKIKIKLISKLLKKNL